MKHVAVIGAGISGLAAAYFLSRRHRVSLFEGADRLGGHTHTVVVPGEAGEVALDTGFLVHNPQTYPLLVRLFDEIGVETAPTDMSFSVSCPATGFEYSSRGLGGFFAQSRRLADPAHYRLLADIVRFNRSAPRVLTQADAEDWTLGDLLRDGRYGEALASRYLLPMTSAVWSAAPACMERFPARTLVRFMQNHGLLSVAAHPAWRVVRHGSHTYVPKLIAPIRTSVHTGAAVTRVRRREDGVTLTFTGRPPVDVDEVVFAVHGDQVLPLLGDDASDLERHVLSQFTTTTNEAWLHTDARQLPAAVRARASWNYRLSGDTAAPPSVTYDLTRLQGLETRVRYCVTLNPGAPLAPDRVLRRFTYRHPRFTSAAVRAQARWREISHHRRTHYCGAYWRYGFHEDGLMSALRVAADLGVRW